MARRSGGKTVHGIISVIRSGAGFVAYSETAEDIYIAPEDLNTALHGDTVEAVVVAEGARGRRTSGRVARIIKRAKTDFVGTLKAGKSGWFVEADDRRMYRPLRLAARRETQLAEKTKVLVRMTRWSDPKEYPESELITIIGKKGEHDTEMRSIVLSHGFQTGFPEAVEREATQIGAHYPISEEEIARRRDFRSATTFTIDPEDAKDFDDALSIRTLPGGDLEIGVHIADVSHYVRHGSTLDEEAQRRGTSIYLVDRTIPMLPEALSNDLCSLNPGEDKLAYAAVFTMTHAGTVKERWFGKTVIHSNRRFSYEGAQRVIEDKRGEFAEELMLLNELARGLREERFVRGAVDFDQPEIRFKLDSRGYPVDIIRKERLDAHKLIEEFMLLANREVAAFMTERLKDSPHGQRAFVYRIHDIPDPDRIGELEIFIRALGYTFESRKGKISGRELNRLFRDIEGTSEEKLIKTATLRSMAKAIYSTKNIGHFGLAFDYYTHFTSPIRRYPDIMVHRLMKRCLSGEEVPQKDLDQYERLAIRSSEREVSAVEAERDSVRLKQVQYLEKRVGEVFEGTISGVTEWGIYIEERETLAEGMVRIGNLTDDYYAFERTSYALIGRKTKKVYRLGDSVRMSLRAVNLEERTIDWEILEKRSA